MHGGFDAAVGRNRDFLAQNGIGRPRGGGVAVDLGSGPGFQSIPLAELGYAVTAVDTDPLLLRELEEHKGSLPIRATEGDLLDFRRHVNTPAELIVCMTDTVLHLESTHDVRRMFEDCAAALEPGGRLVLTYRTLTQELTGIDRFIPVRSDSDTIFTCFLEYEPETVRVHDLVYRRSGGEWTLGGSWYRKLRLSTEWIETELGGAGFISVASMTARGMTTTIAGVTPAAA